MGALYYIESLEHNHTDGIMRCWWALQSKGYTYDLAKAQTYTKAEAEEIVKGANADGKIHERMWTVEFVKSEKAGVIITAVRMIA